ncbi:hypothetical protein NYP18_05290 [Corynebacterium sp. YIM 101645]|uniref:Secreted protein n=1 Tax=Corynebacterium lemuris TaxID=1859292 RepID=A0ABT2FV04_9CORY|nr:hypothetical protein [Corynebacterium lemuris]MCS5479069.1 hypothetical protein [Corynebacterium lemuris]
MTRSEGTTLIALLTIIAIAIAGLVAAVSLGARDDAGAVVAAETAVVAPTPEPAQEPLEQVTMNSINGTEVPAASDTWGGFEHIRSWEGELTVWQDSPAQLILGPGGNWFPAGQPGCGDGAHLITFTAAEGELLTAQLADALGTPVRTGSHATGWMLADDCHLPYVQLADEAGSAQVSYTVHEYQPAGR